MIIESALDPTNPPTGRRGGREPTPPPTHRRRVSLRRRRSRFAYLLLTPGVLFLCLLIGYPLFVAVQLSFTPGRFATLSNAARTFSLEQYTAVFTDPDSLAQLGRTVVYVVGTIAPAFGLGLVVALLLRHPFAGRRWLRSLILLPWAVPGIAASAIFLWMFNASFGVLDKILMALHLIDSPIAWYSNEKTAMAAVIIPTAWKLFPFFAMILLASLQTVPNELYESAQVDGASRWMQYRVVTWPGIRGAAYAALVITTLGVFREFDFIYPLTRGGPNDATTTLAISIYREAFEFSNMGFAAALGVVTALIAAVFVIFGGRIMSRAND